MVFRIKNIIFVLKIGGESNIWTVFVKRGSSHFLDISILYMKIVRNFTPHPTVTLPVSSDNYFMIILACALRIMLKIHFSVCEKGIKSLFVFNNFTIFHCLGRFVNRISTYKFLLCRTEQRNY